MEDTWQTDDDTGTRRFHHAGWTLVVWGWRPERIEVMPPGGDVEVDATPEGIECFGETSSGGYSGYMGVRFTIPWRIVSEIAAFHVQSGRD
jgi:hypothetical protein